MALSPACGASFVRVIFFRHSTAPSVEFFFVMPSECRASVLRFPDSGRQKPDLRRLLRIPSFGPQRTAGLLTATVLQPAARDSVATLLLWAEGGYEKPGKTCLPSLFQRRVATLFRTIFSHSEQSPLSFRAQSTNLLPGGNILFGKPILGRCVGPSSAYFGSD